MARSFGSLPDLPFEEYQTPNAGPRPEDGVAGMTARNADELEGALREAFATNGPVLISVPVGEMPSPWHLIVPQYFKRGR